MQRGDFVIGPCDDSYLETGIVLSTGHNMWGEEIEGQETGVNVLWNDGIPSIVPAEDLKVLSEAR
jgi:hypothetical protein